MKKFDDQDIPGAKPDGSDPVLRLVIPRPALARGARDEGLRALVGFAIGRGYYEHWNKANGPGVAACKSNDFPTDKDGDSN
jgi:hypothetical protein